MDQNEFKEMVGEGSYWILLPIPSLKLVNLEALAKGDHSKNLALSEEFLVKYKFPIVDHAVVFWVWRGDNDTYGFGKVNLDKQVSPKLRKLLRMAHEELKEVKVVDGHRRTG